jgi:hypothetical protein
MRTSTIIISVFVAIISAIIAPIASASVLVSAGQSLRFNYDLSASPQTGPFGGATSGIFVDPPNQIDQGDRFTLTLFDSANTLLLPNAYENLNAFPYGGSQTADSFLAPTSDKIGHAILTVEHGSFLLSSVLVGYNDGVHFPDFIFIGGEQGIPVTVAAAIPEPATLTLFGLGLIGLARLRRR